MHMTRLAARARPVVEAALRLQGALTPDTRSELRELVRAMNSYHSNGIEGQSTHPLNIEKALRQDFSDTPEIAKRQRIALAHIEAEKALETLALPEVDAFKSATLRTAHEYLYQRLAVEDRQSDDGQEVAPGRWREVQVAVYRHEPPPAAAIPLFLARTDTVYASGHGLETLLTVAACAHHRLAWVHPFLDGNGRAIRLQLHAGLHALTDGLWSANRGLARQRDRYYQCLSEADMARQGDMDGRGNLSERMLVQWCEFFIDVCRDQVDFMTALLQPQTLKARLAALIRVRMAEREDYREELILPLLHVLAVGPVSRKDFTQMTGLGATTARKSMSRLLRDGLLKSASHKSEVHIGIPLDALSILLPNLYPEAAAVSLE
jgi:Fic family protein